MLWHSLRGSAQAALKDVEVSASIDRLFRYIQMLVTTAILSLITTELYSPSVALRLEEVLITAANVYLTLPLCKWIIRHISPRHEQGSQGAQDRVATGLLVALVSTFLSVYGYDEVSALQSSVRVDASTLRKAFYVSHIRRAEDRCINPEQSWDEVRACIDRVDKTFAKPSPAKP